MAPRKPRQRTPTGDQVAESEKTSPFLDSSEHGQTAISGTRGDTAENATWELRLRGVYIGDHSGDEIQSCSSPTNTATSGMTRTITTNMSHLLTIYITLNNKFILFNYHIKIFLFQDAAGMDNYSSNSIVAGDAGSVVICDTILSLPPPTPQNDFPFLSKRPKGQVFTYIYIYRGSN